MKTDAKNTDDKADDKTSQSDKKPATPLRRAGRVGLSILNPFSDLGVIYRQGLRPTTGWVRQAWAMLKQPSTPGPSLDWEQAVKASGKPVEHLQATFKRIRIAWWCVMVIGSGLALSLTVMVLLAQGLPTGTLLRAVMTILLLAGLGGVGFVKTLVATYRLWQLQTRRVSKLEGGTFQDFHAETRWFRKVLTLGQFND